MAKRHAPPEHGTMIHVRIADDVHRRLRVRVAELDTTIQTWVATLVARELDDIECGRGVAKGMGNEEKRG